MTEIERENSANRAVVLLQTIKPGQMKSLAGQLTKEEMQIIKTQLGRMGVHGITFDTLTTEKGCRTVIYRPEQVRSFRRR